MWEWVSGEGRQINIKIISRQYKREKEIYEWSVWHTFRRIHKLCLSLSRLSFLFRVITIIFLYLLSTIIVCNIKKNIYSALIPLLLFLILNSLTHSSLVIVSHFPWSFYGMKYKKKFCWNYYFWNIFKLQVQR